MAQTLSDAESALKRKTRSVYALLVKTYGVPPWEPDDEPLGGLIATVLSQHTSDPNSERAYRQLRAKFPTWDAVRDAPLEDLAETVRPGGLAHMKARRIQAILRELSARSPDHQPDLAMIRDLPLDGALDFLEELPGVGPKTAACVLLFNLGQPAFPVDTHVLRVTQRLGLIKPRTTADAAHHTLRALIPPEWRHTMHVDLVAHGRAICHARQPECGRCPLRGECDYYHEVVLRS